MVEKLFCFMEQTIIKVPGELNCNHPVRNLFFENKIGVLNLGEKWLKIME